MDIESDKNNPYESDSPEWQLWEQMNHARHLADAYEKDSARYSAMAAKSREKFLKFKEVLHKIVN